MNDFELYFNSGKSYILNYATGYNHILFIVALCSLYLMRDWKKILILLTAFIAGHSIALALAMREIIPVKGELIEFLIPLTIFITAVSNIFRNTEPTDRTTYVNYGFVFFFALLQGLYFSNYLKAILGRDRNTVPQLFAFEVGLEAGQLIVALIFLIVSFILVDLFTVDRRDWKLILSSVIAGMALLLLKDRIFW